MFRRVNRHSETECWSERITDEQIAIAVIIGVVFEDDARSVGPSVRRSVGDRVKQGRREGRREGRELSLSGVRHE